jgi:hypothetical protein
MRRIRSPLQATSVKNGTLCPSSSLNFQCVIFANAEDITINLQHPEESTKMTLSCGIAPSLKRFCRQRASDHLIAFDNQARISFSSPPLMEWGIS